ncbi:TetR/AcrR family transcriptional regulator [Streptosporangium roseum]|uniref:Transcriptional regulator, TetR family n=1 Tax=Streptosporangium roseum (strain ATCC 12428 / DSM 43021 / JCM 3005 / KCTC 9067 / NCIMB 10171 / NRRL 2505 / NI 9100) TaxID=479432 RepID=D2AZZ3_STRRD|nr:helix-turn-helix domain-containing protein [Streptosporangium roseum]ACZ87227.1 putative transcriptional regulator, TetR family [Streptosporangium roseum DSM 43021]
MSDVKRTGKRAQKAQETRRRILAAALELFVQDGYGATNLQDVADRAGVAVQTIYFVFGNKRALLKELVDVTIAGDDEPVATMDRPWYAAALAAGTARDMLCAYVAGTSVVLERVAPIGRVLEAAVASDPEVAALWPHDVDPRYVVQQGAAGVLVGKPGARMGVSAEEAADLLYGLLSPELYLLFVQERGWPRERWERWVGETLCAQLCAD